MCECTCVLGVCLPDNLFLLLLHHDRQLFEDSSQLHYRLFNVLHCISPLLNISILEGNREGEGRRGGEGGEVWGKRETVRRVTWKERRRKEDAMLEVKEIY